MSLRQAGGVDPDYLLNQFTIDNILLTVHRHTVLVWLTVDAIFCKAPALNHTMFVLLVLLVLFLAFLLVNNHHNHYAQNHEHPERPYRF